MIIGKNVTIKLKEKTILDSFSFTIKQGNKVLLRGDSGSGKSLLMQSLLGFFPISNGDITIQGKRMNKENKDFIRSQIAYAPQMPNLPDIKIELLFAHIFNYKLNRKKILAKNKLMSLLSHFRLAKTIMKTRYGTLSGGEKQRIFFILLWLLERPILFLDEPVSAMDSALKIKLKEMVLQSNKTVFIISHAQEFITDNQFETLEPSWISVP